MKSFVRANSERLSKAYYIPYEAKLARTKDTYLILASIVNYLFSKLFRATIQCLKIDLLLEMHYLQR